MINEKLNKLTFKIQKKPLFNSPTISTNKNAFNFSGVPQTKFKSSSSHLQEKFSPLIKNEEDLRFSFNSEKSKGIDARIKATMSKKI